MAGSAKTLSIMLAVLSPLASAQKLVGTRNIFDSDRQPVTIEQYNPLTRGSHPAVMVVHGGGGPEGDWRHSGIIEALVAAGYCVFVPHYFDSGGKWTPSTTQQQFPSYIRTLNDATRYIAQQPGVDNKGVGVVGLSLGGYLVLGLAEEVRSHPPPLRSPQIKAVVEFYGGMPEFAAARMTTMAPVLILHGARDNIVPAEKAHELEELLKQKNVPFEVQIYPEQGHGFEGEAAADANRRMVAFLKTHVH